MSNEEEERFQGKKNSFIMNGKDLQKFCNEMEAFLLFGPEPSSNINHDETTIQSLDTIEERTITLQEIKKHQELYQSYQQKQKEFHEHLLQTQYQVQTLYDNLTEQHQTLFLPKYEKYLQCHYQIQLYSMMKQLIQLDTCQDLLQIPSMIVMMKEKMPSFLHDRSHLKKQMIHIIEKKKKFFLDKFYYFFENHFQEVSAEGEGEGRKERDERQSSSAGVSSSSSSSSSSSWETFLKQSRHWLLTYILLSLLLPILLQQSQNAILAAFKESLDTALTPLWGRFYYHLSLSIEIKSQKQILWTFYYSKSFIEMLFNLILQITLDEKLKKLHSTINYLKAAEEQIIEKAIKFLKAHIASIIVIELLPSTSHSSSSASSSSSSSGQSPPWNKEFGIHVIEEVLELDNWLATYLHASAANYDTIFLDSNAGEIIEGRPYYQGITEVIYDCKELFHHWLLEERKLILEKLQLVTSSDEVAFSLPTTNSAQLTDADDIIPLTAAENKTPALTRAHRKSTSELRCYSSIYHCLSYFLLLRDRYCYFPLNAQIILSEIILEPLLCFLLSLLLYRIRNHKLLFQISINTFMNKYPDNEQIDEFHLFQQTVRYLTASFDQSSITFAEKGRLVIGNSERCKKKWTILQNWIPKILITKEQQKSGFNLPNLCKMTFKLSDKYLNHNQYNYRLVSQHPLMKVLQSKGNGKVLAVRAVGGEGGAAVGGYHGGDDNIEESIHLIAELAKTLVKVLEKHYQES